jgi:hypothetical protein
MSNVPVMTIGALALHRVEELGIPNRIAYFTSDAELLAANRHWLAPHFLDENDRLDEREHGSTGSPCCSALRPYRLAT